MKQQPQKQMIVFKPPLQIVQNFTTEINPSKSGNVPVLVPDWFDHPLGKSLLINLIYIILLLLLPLFQGCVGVAIS